MLRISWHPLFLPPLLVLALYTATTSSYVFGSVTKCERYVSCNALPNKPKREDDVVIISEEEARVIATDFGGMNKASAEYILKYMPMYSFGTTGRMRMKKLLRDAQDELDTSEEENCDEEEEVQVITADGNENDGCV